MPNERMRVVATWQDEDGDRWAMRDDGVAFWWNHASNGWSMGIAAVQPVPGCAIEPEEKPAAAGAGPAGLDPYSYTLTAAEREEVLDALAIRQDALGGHGKERIRNLRAKLMAWRNS